MDQTNGRSGDPQAYSRKGKPRSGKPKHAWQCSLCGKTFTAFTDPDGDGTRSMWVQEYAHIKACPKTPTTRKETKMRIVYETEPGRYRVEVASSFTSYDGKKVTSWVPDRWLTSLDEAEECAEQITEDTGYAARVIDTRPEGE